MTERVIVINLPFREDRRHYMTGHLETVGVPAGCIDFFPAKYGGDYENSRAVQAAAEADGFPFLNRHPNNDPRAKNHNAYNWTWAQILRNITQTAMTALVILDDYLLRVDWSSLCMCTVFLNRTQSEFKILQIGWQNLWEDDNIRIDLVSSFVARGIRSYGDYATILNAEGAKLILERMEKRPSCNMERHFYNLSRFEKNKTGLFHMVESKAIGSPMKWPQNLSELG